MLQHIAALIFTSIISMADAYAAAVPDGAADEREFPLAIVFALIAVACALFTVFIAQRSKKKD